MEKLVVHDLGDLMSPRHCLRPIDAQPHLGEQSVSHPACSNLGHGDNPIDGSHGL